MRLSSLVVFLSMLSLVTRPVAIEGQIVPVSQSRSVGASAFGVTTNYAATDFTDFSQNVSFSSNDTVSGMYGSGSAVQGSQIRSSSIQGGGSAQAGGNTGAAAGAASSCSVTFQISSNLVYNLSGSLFREQGPGNGGGPPFLMLSGSTGTVFYVLEPYKYGYSTNFSQTGYLSPGQYTLTTSANASGGSGGGNESFSFNFGVSPPPPFAITAVAQQSNDVLLTWTALPGTTNIVQATSGAADGSYSNSFSDISPLIVISGSNGTTNYLDAGGATNSPARYYRVRVPGS